MQMLRASAASTRTAGMQLLEGGVRGAQTTTRETQGRDLQVRGLTPPREPDPASVHGEMGMLLLMHFL
jgi:hypothetical protein